MPRHSSRNLKPKTLLRYADLKRFAAACPELPLTPEPIERFLADLECSDETTFAYRRRLRALYQFALQRRRIDLKPRDRYGPQRVHKVPPTMEECELRALVAAATN